MKVGYSLILGEYIDARDLDYRDCEPFQVVCPECREPLFKAHRHPDAEHDTHYLAHYSREKAYVQDCELRVAAQHHQQRRRHNAKSRDQRLAYFLEVFPWLLSRDPWFTYPKGIDRFHKRMSRSKAFRHFRQLAWDSFAQRSSTGTTEQIVRDFIKETESLSGQEFPVTGFSIEVQIRVARDMATHLTTPPARHSFFRLFNHATALVLGNMTQPDEHLAPEARVVRRKIAVYIDALLRSGKRQGFELLREMAADPLGPPYLGNEGSYALKVVSEISNEQMGALARLPYLDALRWRADRS